MSILAPIKLDRNIVKFDASPQAKWMDQLIEAHNRNAEIIAALSRLDFKTDTIIQNITRNVTNIEQTIEGITEGFDFGKYGSYEDNGRYWGVVTKIDATNARASFGIANPGAAAGSEGNVPATLTNPRHWNSFGGAVSGTVYGLTIPGGGGGTYWVARPRLRTLIQCRTFITSRRIWVCMASADMGAVTSSSVIRYVGLRYDSAIGPNWYLCSGDGALSSDVDTGVVVQADIDYHIDLDFSAASVLSVKINGAQTTKSNNLPSGATALGLGFTITPSFATSTLMLWHHHMLSKL